jgi:hypothetical protein
MFGIGIPDNRLRARIAFFSSACLAFIWTSFKLFSSLLASHFHKKRLLVIFLETCTRNRTYHVILPVLEHGAYIMWVIQPLVN